MRLAFKSEAWYGLAHDRIARHHDDYHDDWLKPAARDRARRGGRAETRSNASHIKALPTMPSLPARGLLALIQLYKWTLSPLIGRDCRYLPTCSSYAADAIRAHGAWAGGWMATARLCRCHPWGGSGYDPAPREAHAPWFAPWKYGDWAWKRRDPEPREQA